MRRKSIISRMTHCGRRPVGRISPLCLQATFESMKGLMMYRKVNNTCNPVLTGFCLFPKTDSVRIQPPLIALHPPTDVSSRLGGR